LPALLGAGRLGTDAWLGVDVDLVVLDLDRVGGEAAVLFVDPACGQIERPLVAWTDRPPLEDGALV
jgi:hypothetical protein